MHYPISASSNPKWLFEPYEGLMTNEEGTLRLDLVQAVLFDSQTIFTVLPWSQQGYPSALGSILKTVLRSLASGMFASISAAPRHKALICDFRSLVSTFAACLTCAAHGGIANKDNDSFLRCLRKVSVHGFKLNPDSLCYISRACHQAFAILYNVLVNRHPFEHDSNAGYADGAFRAVTLADGQVWEELPFLGIWM